MLLLVEFTWNKNSFHTSSHHLKHLNLRIMKRIYTDSVDIYFIILINENYEAFLHHCSHLLILRYFIHLRIYTYFFH